MILSTAAAVATAFLLSAPAPLADPSDWPVPGSQPADAILMALEQQGYTVGINWVNNGKGVALSRCNVAGYHAAGGPEPAATTVYLDVICHDED